MPQTTESGLFLPDIGQVGWGADVNDGWVAHELHRIHRDLNADRHALHYHLDSIDGDEDFPDESRGWDETRPARGLDQAITDVAIVNGARVILHLKGGLSTKIYTMLADPDNHYVYPTGVLQMPKNLAILGAGGDVRSDAACAVIVDDGTSDADGVALLRLGRYGLAEDVIVVNRRPGGEGVAQSQQAIASLCHRVQVWGTSFNAFVAEGNSGDNAARYQCIAYKCGGYGVEIRDTDTLDGPNQQHDHECDYTQCALGEIHLMATRTNDVTSMNGYEATGARMHGGPGFNGYVHIEGAHHARIGPIGYVEGPPDQFPNTAQALVRGAKSINGAEWVASRAYKVGDIVYGQTGLGSRLYYRCTIAGTAGSSEPQWMKYAILAGADTTVTLVHGADEFEAGDVGKAIAITQGFVTTIASFTSATEVEVTDAIPGDGFEAEVGVWSDAMQVGDTIVDNGATWERIRTGEPRARGNATAYSLGQIIYGATFPDTETKLYKCTTAGTTAGSEPAGYAANNSTITDGSATFQAIGGWTLYPARGITFDDNDWHGSSINAGTDPGLGRLVDVDWCVKFRYGEDSDFRGTAPPDSDNPVASFGFMAYDYDVAISWRQDNGSAYLTAQDQALVEAVPGRGRGKWSNGTEWSTINPDAMYAVGPFADRGDPGVTPRFFKDNDGAGLVFFDDGAEWIDWTTRGVFGDPLGARVTADGATYTVPVTVLTFDVPADYLKIGSEMLVTVGGNADVPSDASPSQVAVQLSIEGTPLQTVSVTPATSSAQSNKAWRASFMLAFRTSNKVIANGIFQNEVNPTAQQGEDAAQGSEQSFDYTAVNTISVELVLGEATSGYVMRAEECVMELVKR